MRSKIHFIIVFLSFSFKSIFLVAQNEGIRIEGQVFAVPDTSILQYVNIIILNRYKGTIADKDGRFSFVCQKYDTLIFSRVGYKTRYFIIPDVGESVLKKNVYMERDTIYLKEVTVFPWKTYDEFKKAILIAHPPETEKEHAEKNIMLSFRQMLYEDDVLDISNPVASYHNYWYNSIVAPMYYRGQIRPLTIFNPVAWYRLFNAIKRGDFKKKKPRYEYWDDEK